MEKRKLRKQMKQCAQCEVRFIGQKLKLYCSKACSMQAYYARQQNPSVMASASVPQGHRSKPGLSFDHLKLAAWLKLQMNETAVQFWKSEDEGNQRLCEQLKAQGIAYARVMETIEQEGFWR